MSCQRPDLAGPVPHRYRNLHGRKAITYTTFGRAFRDWVDQLDLGAGYVAHQARHTLATRLLAHGAGLHHIRRYLGHVSIRMAEHYAKVVGSGWNDDDQSAALAQGSIPKFFGTFSLSRLTPPDTPM